MHEFTLADGNPVSINLNELDYFQPADCGTFLAFKNGRNITIDEDYQDVKAVLEATRE